MFVTGLFDHCSHTYTHLILSCTLTITIITKTLLLQEKYVKALLSNNNSMSVNTLTLVKSHSTAAKLQVLKTNRLLPEQLTLAKPHSVATTTTGIERGGKNNNSYLSNDQRLQRWTGMFAWDWWSSPHCPSSSPCSASHMDHLMPCQHLGRTIHRTIYLETDWSSNYIY